MPEMGGVEATEIIRDRQRKEQCQTVIIGLTANVLEANTERCMAAGMNTVLHKPIQRKKLQEVLTSYTG